MNLVKDVTVAIAPVQDMVNEPTSRGFCCAWHRTALIDGSYQVSMSLLC